jgi:hypothetical protein
LPQTMTIAAIIIDQACLSWLLAMGSFSSLIPQIMFAAYARLTPCLRFSMRHEAKTARGRTNR